MRKFSVRKAILFWFLCLIIMTSHRLSENIVLAADPVSFNSGDVVIDALTVASSGSNYIIKNGVSSVKVTGGVKVSVIFDNVSIGANQTYASSRPPVLITDGSKAEIKLVGKNVFKAGRTQNSSSTPVGYAGLQVDKGSEIEIDGVGSLEAYGGNYTSSSSPYGGAGIGGGSTLPNGTKVQVDNKAIITTPGSITINGGTIKAYGGGQAAGIGGGVNGAASGSGGKGIVINGGSVYANGGSWAAGIGDGDSVNSHTNPDYYDAHYYIRINGGTVYAYGGVQAAGIGATDEVKENLSGIPSGKFCELNIEINGGEITAQSGAEASTLGGSAGIGAGVHTIMRDNSITIGSGAIIRAVSYGYYAISQNYDDISIVPTVNIDPDMYMYLCRFPEYVENKDRTFSLYKIEMDESGNETSRTFIENYSVPANYKALAMVLPGAGKYILKLGDTVISPEFEINIDKDTGTNSGALDGDNYTPDTMSEKLADLQFYKKGTKENAIIAEENSTAEDGMSYVFNPKKNTYDVYVDPGTESVDVMAEWLKRPTTVWISGDGSVYTDVLSQTEKQRKTVNVTLNKGEDTIVRVSKRETSSLEALYNLIAYKVVIHYRYSYNIGIQADSKVYDGTEIKPQAKKFIVPGDSKVVTLYNPETTSTDYRYDDPKVSSYTYKSSVSIGSVSRDITAYTTAVRNKNSINLETDISSTDYLNKDCSIKVTTVIDALTGAKTINRSSSSNLVWNSLGYYFLYEQSSNMYIRIFIEESSGRIYVAYSSMYSSAGIEEDIVSSILFSEGEKTVEKSSQNSLENALESAQNSLEDASFPFDEKTEESKTNRVGIKLISKESESQEGSQQKLDFSVTSVNVSIVSGTVNKEFASIEITDEEMEKIKNKKYVSQNGEWKQTDEKCINTGNYRAESSIETVSFTADGSKDFSITQRPITVASVQNYRKYYDGNSEIDVSDLGEIFFDGNVLSDQVKLKAQSASFDSSEVGFGESRIQLFGISFDESIGDAYKNYYIQDVNPRVYGEIYYISTGAMFLKAESGSDTRWRKYYPTASNIPSYSDSHSFEVRLRTVGNGDMEGVYSFDIAFGDMKFTYSMGEWDPVNHVYKAPENIVADGFGWFGMDGINNRVTVTNRSNKPIYVGFKVDIDFLNYYTGLRGYFTKSTDPSSEQITKDEIEKTNEFSDTPSRKSYYYYFNNSAPQTNSDSYIFIGSFVLSISN